MTGGKTLKTRPVWMGGRRCLRQRPKHAVVLHNVCLFICHIYIYNVFPCRRKKITNGKINKRHVVFVRVMLTKLNIVV